MPAIANNTNSRNVAARIIRVVITDIIAEPRMTTAKIQNITIFAIIDYLVLVLNLPITRGAPPSMRSGRLPP